MAGFVKATGDVLSGVADVATVFSNAAKLANVHMELAVKNAQTIADAKATLVEANKTQIAQQWFEEKYGKLSNP